MAGPRKKTPKKSAASSEVVDVEPVSSETVVPDEAELHDAMRVADAGDDEVPDVESLPPTSALVATEKAPSRRDALAAYMAEVSRHPLLTREEEQKLAEQFHATQDVKAAYRLVAANLRLVVKLAHEYHRNPISLLDLIQEGNLGLMQAVKKYDHTRGVKLSSYAAWWIRAYILRYIMDNWKMVKVGTTEAQRKLFFKLRQEQRRLAAEGIDVTPKLLAERLDVTEAEVVEMDQRLGNDEVSLDAPTQNAEGGQEMRAERLLPPAPGTAEEELGNEQVKERFLKHLEAFKQGLGDKDRYIVEKRLLAEEPMTLQDIGTHFGFSRERARQLEAALIDRMRTFMKAKIPDFEFVATPPDAE